MKIGVISALATCIWELWAARAEIAKVLAKALDRNIEFHQIPCFPRPDRVAGP